MTTLKVRNFDRAKLSAQQLVDLDRIGAARLQTYIESVDKVDGRQVDMRDKFFDWAAASTDEQFRARVNVIGVSMQVNFALESDYDAIDTTLIQAVRPRSKWGSAIPQLLADAAILRGANLSEQVIVVILGRET